MSEPRDIRLRRLRMRSWRRGMREMDLLLGPFADTALDGLTPEALDIYDALLWENDQELYLWVSQGRGAPACYAEILSRIAEFNRIAAV